MTDPRDGEGPHPAAGARPHSSYLDNARVGASRRTTVALVQVAESDPWWHSTAYRALEHLAALGEPFDAYSLTELGVTDPDHPARWGAVFLTAHLAGLIEPTGYRPSRRPSRAGGVCAVWVGRPSDRVVP